MRHDPFNHRGVMKAGIRHTNSESTRPREKFQRYASRNSLILFF